LEGWLIGGVGVDWHVGTANPSQNPTLVSPHFEPAQDGSLVIDLNLDGGSTGTGTISQTFTTDPGTAYYASFYMAGVNRFGDLREVQVDVDGVSRIFSQTTSPQLGLVWGLKSFDWTATGSQATLTFSSRDASSFWGPLIDNVSVKAAPVPEPATMLLLGTGIVGMAASRIRRKKK